LETSLIKHLPVNERGRDLVIGDLHGCWSLLERALAKVKFDPAADRLISVGDLVDRGPESLRCLKLLREPWFHCVRGNHEQLLIDAVRSRGSDSSSAMWLRNGGAWGIEHYHDNAFSPELQDLSEQAAALPLLLTVDLPEGRKFHVLHAELRPYHALTDTDLADQDIFEEVGVHSRGLHGEAPVLWGRFNFAPLYGQQVTPAFRAKFLRTVEYHKSDALFTDGLSPIYSGHTVVQRPTRFKGQTVIDTGAFYGERYKWSGLTVTEPLTDSFWLSTATSCRKAKVVTL
jgi:serine/threonine protein phosphatase 1